MNSEHLLLSRLRDCSKNAVMPRRFLSDVKGLYKVDELKKIRTEILEIVNCRQIKLRGVSINSR